MKYVCCKECHKWFEARHKSCPHCEQERPAWNEALISQAWRSNLNWHAEHADKHT